MKNKSATASLTGQAGTTGQILSTTRAPHNPWEFKLHLCIYLFNYDSEFSDPLINMVSVKHAVPDPKRFAHSREVVEPIYNCRTNPTESRNPHIKEQK